MRAAEANQRRPTKTATKSGESTTEDLVAVVRTEGQLFAAPVIVKAISCVFGRGIVIPLYGPLYAWLSSVDVLSAAYH